MHAARLLARRALGGHLHSIGVRILSVAAHRITGLFYGYSIFMPDRLKAVRMGQSLEV